MFQKVCQKRFQIELQNIHQIRCRKEGPNRMPDGMSEYMPDNMSAGGAHSKKIIWKNGPERPGFPKIIPIRPRYGPDTAPIRPRYGSDIAKMQHSFGTKKIFSSSADTVCGMNSDIPSGIDCIWHSTRRSIWHIFRHSIGHIYSGILSAIFWQSILANLLEYISEFCLAVEVQRCPMRSGAGEED